MTAWISAIGAKPTEAYMGRDLLCIFHDEDTVRNLNPDMEKLKDLDGLLLQVTAAGKAVLYSVADIFIDGPDLP